jgi:hypothetical protein
MSPIYPEIETALVELKLALENYVNSNAVAPSMALKAKIPGAV